MVRDVPAPTFSTSPMVRVPCRTYSSVTSLPLLTTLKVVLPAANEVLAGSHVDDVDTTCTASLDDESELHAARPVNDTAARADRTKGTVLVGMARFRFSGMRGRRATTT